MGRSDTCQFTGLKWATIDIQSVRGVKLTDKWGRVSDNSVRTCGTGCVQSTLQASAVSELYWTIPCEEFGNNLVTSYGSTIRYKINYNGHQQASAFVCASIRGQSSTYFSRCNSIPQSGADSTFELHENTWMQPNNKAVTRERFMMLLARCKTISIRAKFNSDTNQVSLSNIQYDKAIDGNTGNPVSTVETCECPVGYTGNFTRKCISARKKIIFAMNLFIISIRRTVM